jgi:integrase
LNKTKAAARKLNFTKRSLEALPARTEGGRNTVFDFHTPGLGFTVFPTGVRTFFHLRLVRGYPQRTTIGRFPEVSVEQARGKASELNASLAKWKLNNYAGGTPFDSRRDLTLQELTDQYVEKQIRIHASRPDRAAEAVEWRINKYLSSWKNRKLGSIRKADVVELHDQLGRDCGQTNANRTVQMLRTMFYWAEDAEIWQGVNPAARIKMFHEEKRSRFLQPNELPLFFNALSKEKNPDFIDFVNLALWTGARRGDILSMRWEDISLEDNRWDVPHPKNRTPYSVPLTPEAVAILQNRMLRISESPWVFPSGGKTGHVVDLRKPWERLLKTANLNDANLRQHDLRRTLGSYQATLGTNLTIIGKSLGHRSLAATQVYAQVNLDTVRNSVMAATRTMIAASKPKPISKLTPLLKHKALKAGRSDG